MKFLSLVAVACVTVSARDHYAKMASLLEVSHTSEDANLALLRSNVQLKSPMVQIAEQVTSMISDVRKERTADRKKYLALQKSCDVTGAQYSSDINRHEKLSRVHRTRATSSSRNHRKLAHMPAKAVEQRKAYNVSVSQQEVKVKRGQASRDAVHVEFLKLQAAFEKAISEIDTIGRVLNGQGTLGDRHGAVGFLEEQSCSSRFNQMKEDAKDFPHLASMLESFSKAMETVEAPTAAVTKTAAGTEAKVQVSTKDMDAINMILAKVHENLISAMKTSYDMEVKAINLWKNEKQDRRKKINNQWIKTWTNLKDQGTVESQIGTYWKSEGQSLIDAQKHTKRADEIRIQQEFLKAMCKREKRNYPLRMMSNANQLNALSAVMRYLRQHVFTDKSVWKAAKINAAITSTYKWELDDPIYLDVANTYSTTNFDDDAATCKTPFTTVFSKVRVLKEVNTSRYFLDPNDLSYSKNFDIKMENEQKILQCSLFPNGIPLGQVHSCSKDNFATSVIDLTNTNFQFGPDAKSMFKVIGRKTDGSSVTFDKSGLVATLKVRGRCGDIYSEDLAADQADFRADPIPLDKNQNYGSECAEEAGECKCNGKVFYGAYGKVVSKTVYGKVTCDAKSMGKDPEPNAKDKKCWCTPRPIPAPPRESRENILGHKCAREHSVCKCNGVVSYGARGRFATLASLDSVPCNNRNFGDPIRGVVKDCFCSPTPLEMQGKKCAREHASKGGNVCKCNGTVKYGAMGKWSSRKVNGSITCNNRNFGDPFWGVVKDCFCISEGK